MVSVRCVALVIDEFTKLGLQAIKVEIGQVEINEAISDAQHSKIRLALLQSGFELLDDKKKILIHQIKTNIIELVHYTAEPLKYNLSTHLSIKLNHDYTYMSNLFSEELGITIEKFFICHKIERVKELLAYDELTLTEIAFKLGYSSVAHLSNQFKKVTGFTPTHFKQHKDNHRSSLEDI